MKFSYIERMSPADWVVVTEALTLENNGAAGERAKGGQYGSEQRWEGVGKRSMV